MNGLELIKTIFFMKLKLFTRAGILITTRCSTGCRFCVYGNLKIEDIKKKTIEKGLELFQKLKINHIGISGGEPFESYDNLIFSSKKDIGVFTTKNLIFDNICKLGRY